MCIYPSFSNHGAKKCNQLKFIHFSKKSMWFKPCYLDGKTTIYYQDTSCILLYSYCGHILLVVKCTYGIHNADICMLMLIYVPYFEILQILPISGALHSVLFTSADVKIPTR